MVLSNIIVHFEAGEPSRQDIEILNSGAETLYVQMEPKLVHNPGTEEERREPISNPREAGLLVTPSKLALAPGASKRVRFVNLGRNTDEERIYRIAARPISNPVTAEQNGVKILIGYEILAIAYPAAPSPDLAIERNGRTLKVQNQGNTNVLLREIFQCESVDQVEEECESLAGRRMYPGNSWELDLPQDRPVRLYQSIGMRNSVHTIQ
ncbi:MAG: fimbria/pilus periplasmic chaperone [Pseudomonadota bacterium]